MKYVAKSNHVIYGVAFIEIDSFHSGDESNELNCIFLFVLVVAIVFGNDVN